MDQNQTFYWNQRAAEHGDPGGQSALAWCFQQGVGTQPNSELAFKWWLEAAQQGVPEANTQSPIVSSAAQELLRISKWRGNGAGWH